MVFERNKNFERPEVIKFICDSKGRGERNNLIMQRVFEEFGFKITAPTIKAIYDRNIAKSMIIQSKQENKLAAEIVPDFQKNMNDRFEKITKVTDDLMDTLSELKDSNPELYLKYVPNILAVCREILNQLSYIRKEQSQILINQKNVIYSPMQIMNILDTELRKLEKDGRIEIKNTTKQGRVLTEEESKHLILSIPKTKEEVYGQQI